MKGPGSRVIDANSLKSVTPAAAGKTRFVIVDAVGLCKPDKNQSKSLDRQPTVTLERVLKEVSKASSTPSSPAHSEPRSAALPEAAATHDAPTSNVRPQASPSASSQR